MTWHVDARLWRAYTDGSLDAAAAASIDTHVVSCRECQQAARELVPREKDEDLWRQVQATVTRPRVAPPLRWLTRLGVPEDELVLLGAADAVMLPWVSAVAAALVCGLLSGVSSGHQHAVFLALAPLVPLLAVVAAFEATEDLREISAPTPYSKLRLALLRATTALAVALPVTALIGLVITPVQELTFAWLLPGLALTCTALVGLTWLQPWAVGVGLSAAWAGFVALMSRMGHLELLTGPGAQASLAATAALLAAVFVARLTSWRLMGGGAA